MEFRELAATDLEAARALLVANELPIEDLGDPAITLLGAFTPALVGVVGLQVCDDVGLLRSLAVDARARSHGLGRQLCDRALSIARSRELRAVYLLTTTAADYFARLGFELVERDATPAAIRATAQFTSLCPGTASIMRRRDD